MKRALLDVNVLLALLDSDHVDHERAREWLEAEIRSGWASCPITENGFVRVLDRSRVHGPRQVTDAYLLALAVRHGGRLVTFDSSVVRSAVPEAAADALTIL
ncbi:PIN domain-containing protein [Pseudonocardia nantongensis]|uniref:PIN domain-containing protein n=1 Tax=Pseudonocardia nantongensis TaxID=1181885 RepID=UPI00397E26A1